MACSAFFVAAKYRSGKKKEEENGAAEEEVAKGARPAGRVIVELSGDDVISIPTVSIALSD